MALPTKGQWLPTVAFEIRSLKSRLYTFDAQPETGLLRYPFPGKGEKNLIIDFPN